MTAVSSINAGGRILASAIQGIAPLAVIKGADQSVASNASAYVTDNALSVAVVANATYIFWSYLFYLGNTNGNGDLDLAWVSPSGATLSYQVVGVNVSNAANVSTTVTGNNLVQAATTGVGNNMGLTMTGSLVMSSTPGNFYLEWCQAHSNSTATTIKAGSFLTLWRIS